VAINEAVDLAKYFSSSEASKFVNGILDQVRKKHQAGTPGKAVPPTRKPAGGSSKE
jgi:hypothetical protein